LLGLWPRGLHEKPAERSTQDPMVEVVGSAELHDPSLMLPAGRPGIRLPNKPPARNIGSVKSFALDRLFPADGQRLDMKELVADYRTWCSKKGLGAAKLDRFLDEIEAVCRRAGIAIAVGDDKRVYCLGVKLKNGAAPASVATPTNLTF